MESSRFPIRIKVLLALLFIVTGVVSLITFTMASMFHEDKRAYINDLTSIVTIGAAEESRSILMGYAERLKAYERVLIRDDFSRDMRSELVAGFFHDFTDLVAVSMTVDGKEVATVHDSQALQGTGLSVDDLKADMAAHAVHADPSARENIHVRNSTLSAKMPAFTLSVTHGNEDGTMTVIAGVIRLEELMKLAARSTAFDVSLIDSRGAYLAHRNPTLVSNQAEARLAPEFTALKQTVNAAMTLEYETRGMEVVGGFAATGIGGVAATAEVPKSAAFLASRELLNRLFVIALTVLGLAAITGLIGARRITRPVERLVRATREIAMGHFDSRIQVKSNDEFGTLADSFNQMATGLKERDQALHETQAQLVQSEKMAAFGQLGAGIAHEVKNPLAGILGCAQLSLRKVDRETPVHKNLTMIEKETKRCKTIIENLLKFARQERTVLSAVNINHVCSETADLMRHQLELNKCKLVLDLSPDLPLINGNSNQLQQVLMNFMMNAEQAMGDEKGTVTLSTRTAEGGRVEVSVSDTGTGIPEENMGKLFEPFFTTKPGGKGTGLGLSVSFGIIKDHHGEIRVDSPPGKGATFTISLQVAPGVVQEPPVLQAAEQGGA